MKIDLLKNEYLCFAQMFDSAGNPMPLRPAFRNLGKHFFDLTYPSKEVSGETIVNLMRIRAPHGTQQTATVEFVIATREGSGSQSFYNLGDVFDIKNPGKYKARLQFQAYARIYKGGNSFAYKLERFEPMEFTVIKE